MTTPLTLHEWHGVKTPESRTLRSLDSAIPPLTYSEVYWIAKTVDNVIVEYYPVTDWYFTDAGQLIGEVDSGSLKKTVTINPAEYVILSVR